MRRRSARAHTFAPLQIRQIATVTRSNTNFARSGLSTQPINAPISMSNESDSPCLLSYCPTDSAYISQTIFTTAGGKPCRSSEAAITCRFSAGKNVRKSTNSRKSDV